MGKKLGNPGKVGKVSTGKKSPPPPVVGVRKIDTPTIGSALGILNKHFNGVK